ncbi:MAG: BamA/TamA family outer membrane protein [Bacteroidales bacterium]|nr:BamA/TamA family outer membrane protein [Bacteroidales bacterium]
MTLATSCSVDKYIGADDMVLYANRIDVTMDDGSKPPQEIAEALSAKRNYLVQKPNSRLLWIGRFSMRVYCLSNPDSKGPVSNYLRRQGQAPVVYDEYSAIRSAQQIETLLASKGCFGSKVNFDTIKVKGKDITIGYQVHPRQRYRIDEVVFRAETPAVAKLLEDLRGASLLKEGDWYDQDNMSAERTRIVEALRNEGYYKVTKELVSFEVDTTYTEGLLSITVLVRGTNLKVYHLNNIFIYPNSSAGLQSERLASDTLIHNYKLRTRTVDYQFVYDKKMTIRPQTICRNLFLFPGQTYRPRNVASTYNSLLGLHNFRYIDIEFAESPSSTDTLPLVDARVRLLNSTQQKISLSLEITNASPFGAQETGNFLTNGNFGVESVLEYQHKNLFGGAELLKAQGSLLVELPKNIFRTGAGEFYDNFTAFETGLDLTLNMPRLLLPFTSNISWQRVKPHTLLSLGANYQYRSYFERMLANVSFGYSWSHNRRVHHQLLPLEFTYANFFNLDQGFLSRLSSVSDLRLKYLYSDHFIMDARYDYIYTNQVVGSRSNFEYFRFQVESAGNVLSGLSHAFNGPVDDNGIRQIFDVPYSQYIRFSTEYKRYFYHGGKSTFVGRVLLGLGVPYANSQAMPYEKSFFGGGSTTMRAWQLRRLGPGSYRNNTDDVIERMGDMTLVLNLEERVPIVGVFEAAAFADVGNVWLLRPSNDFPDGEFGFGKLLKEMAVGVGLGLRVNVSIMTVRLDFGIPLYDPGYDAAYRWRPPHWHINQVVTNLGIDYPF